ncbi:MAG: sugar transporter [endosymbiont of Galathealinum brachiosum]|uniref:Sugar transporter n=1 Tax=endosymbiont of Galathealinum brachiosum TaxID=2200906 RepID=A0A370D7Y1_9GAMM|nr:MAG: sugar transporter [endosymbiont of Galathealinum brachiosum]
MNRYIRKSSKTVLQTFFQGLIIFMLSSSVVLAAPSKTATSMPSYKIGPGDILNISVWKEEGLQQEVLIRPDGGMSFPLAGDLHAGGKSVSQLQKLLASKIKQYIPDPVVTVAVRKIENNKIFVVGKVNRPGEYIGTSYIDVMQALAMAGGLNAYASSNNIKILRRVNGNIKSMLFEYDEVAGGYKLKQNIILQSGDVVVVP